MRIIERVELGILTVYRQSVLREVVCADREELNLLGELLCEHNGGGSFDHDTDLDLTDLLALGDKLLTALLEDLLRVLDLAHGNDHREHDADLAVSSGSEQGSELSLEDVVLLQADTDSAVTERWVILLGKVEVVSLLVGADIEGSDDDLLAAHDLGDALVDSELFVLGREGLGVEINELGAEKSDAARVVLEHHRGVGNVADVCINVDLCAVEGDVGLLLELLEKRSLLYVLDAFLVEGIEQILSRLNVNAVVVAVDDRELAVPVLVDLCTDESGNIHVAGENRGVAVGAAEVSDKAQQLALVELYGLGRSQILSDDDKRLVALVNAAVGACEYVDYASGDILYVGGARLHVLVVHRREGLGKVLARRLDGVLGGLALCIDDFSD